MQRIGFTDPGALASPRAASPAARAPYTSPPDDRIASEYLDRQALLHHFGIVRAAALLSHGNGEANPVQLAAGYLRNAIKAGAHLHAPHEIVDIACDRKAVTLRTHDDIQIHAKHVVFCTGYELARIVPAKDYTIHSTGAIATRPQPRAIWPQRALIWEAQIPPYRIEVAATAATGRCARGPVMDGKLWRQSHGNAHHRADTGIQEVLRGPGEDHSGSKAVRIQIGDGRRDGLRAEVACRCRKPTNRWCCSSHNRRLSDLKLARTVCPRSKGRRWSSHVIPDGCVDAAYSIGALPNRGRGASSFSLFPMTQYAAISQPMDAVRAALAVLALGQFGPTHAESLSDGHFVDEVPRLLEQYSRQGDFQLPSLSITELDTLAAGKTVVALFREPTAPVDMGRVVGWQVVAAPRLLVWLSILEGSEESSARLKHSTLTRRAAGAYVSYHHIDLPWPVKDRQWTLLGEKNLSLAEHSHDLIWEHRWELLPRDDALLEDAYEHGLIPGLTRQVLDVSVYLGANRGAWILFDLGARGTLVAAYMDIDLGGHIPDSLVRSFAKRQLTAFLESLSALRGAHYDGTPIIHDGRGLPITREAAIAAGLVQLDQPRLVNALP